MSQPTATFASIQDEEYISLITLRKNGDGVPTPVWFAQDQGNGFMYIETGATYGKVKRIRHTPVVTLTACTFTGKTYGETIEGRARIVNTAREIYQARGALHRKYGFRRQVFYGFEDAVRILRRQPEEKLAYIAIEPLV